MSSFSFHFNTDLRRSFATVCALCTLLAPHCVYAQNTDAVPLSSYLIKTVFGLLFAAALAWGVLFAFQKVNARRSHLQTSTYPHRDSPHTPLRVVDTLTLSPTRSILLVEAPKTLLVLSSTEHGITLLTRLQPTDPTPNLYDIATTAPDPHGQPYDSD